MILNIINGVMPIELKMLLTFRLEQMRVHGELGKLQAMKWCKWSYVWDTKIVG